MVCVSFFLSTVVFFFPLVFFPFVQAAGTGVSRFVEAVMPTIFDRLQVKALSSCVNSLDTSCKGSITAGAREACGQKLMAEEAGVDESHAMRVYRKAHGKEEDLNKNFNTYSTPATFLSCPR